MFNLAVTRGAELFSSVSSSIDCKLIYFLFESAKAVSRSAAFAFSSVESELMSSLLLFTKVGQRARSLFLLEHKVRLTKLKFHWPKRTIVCVHPNY